MMERVADYVIRKVREAGVGTIYMVTGRGILYLTDAVARDTQLKAVSTYHEQGASYAAMAYAALKGIGACLVSTGCAATNALTAALCAYQDNLPLIFISGNHMLEETTRYTGKKIRTYGSQEADIVSMAEPVTKYAVMLTDKEHVVYETEKAIHEAVSGRRGPVWIDIPLNVQNMRIEESAQEHFTPAENSKAAADEADIDYLRKLLNEAKRPLLLLGGGAYAAEKEIAALVERMQIPVVFTPAACDIYGSRQALSVGAIGSIGGSRAGNFCVQNSDALLVLGSRLGAQETGIREAFAREARIAVVDIDPVEHEKEGVAIDKVIYGDVKAVLCRLLQTEFKSVSPEWTEKCRHWKQCFAVGEEAFVKEHKARGSLELYSVAADISEQLPQDAVVITDAGLEELIIPSAVAYGEGQRCIFPAAQGAMGYAVPAILGAYDAGRRNIFCVVGDGSCMMNLQELALIQARKIPVKILLINNNMYAIIRKRQKDLFKNRTIGNDPEDGLPAPEYEKIAQAFGYRYFRLEDRESWLSKMQEIFALEEPVICELMCDAEQKYLHESYALEGKRLVKRPIEDLSPFMDREIFQREMVVEPWKQGSHTMKE